MAVFIICLNIYLFVFVDFLWRIIFNLALFGDKRCGSCVVEAMLL